MIHVVPLLLALWATTAVAVTRFVDGGCGLSGNGSTITCGTTGPFRTIGEGVLAMNPGDILEVRGAHGSFNGTYFESLSIRSGGALPGKVLTCSAGARCVIRGCRAPACPTNEVPLLRGMMLRTWTNLGSGIYSRPMEASPNTDPEPPDERDDFDPGHMLQGTSYPLTNLAYAGDGVLSPSDGRWSYFPGTQEVRVNPIGAADPNTDVYVPHLGMGVYITNPSAYVTVAHMNFEGYRQKILELRGTGHTFQFIRGSYWTQHGGHSSPNTYEVRVEDSVIEYGGRGRSWAPATSDAAMGLRFFHVDNGAIVRTVVRHLGSNGAWRYSCGTTICNPNCQSNCANGWACATCDPPWNSNTHTHVSISGVGIQVKQTDTFTLEDNTIEDVGAEAIVYDVSRHVTGTGNIIRRCGSGFNFRTPGTSAPGFTYTCDADFTNNTIDDSGSIFFVTGGATRCSLNIPNDTALEPSCTYVAHINDNIILNPNIVAGSSSAICPDNTPPSIDHPPLVVATNNQIITGSTSSTTSTSSTSTSSTTLPGATTTSSTSSTTTSSTSSTSSSTTSSSTSTTSTSVTSTTRPPKQWSGKQGKGYQW